MKPSQLATSSAGHGACSAVSPAPLLCDPIAPLSCLGVVRFLVMESKYWGRVVFVSTCPFSDTEHRCSVTSVMLCRPHCHLRGERCHPISWHLCTRDDMTGPPRFLPAPSLPLSGSTHVPTGVSSKPGIVSCTSFLVWLLSKCVLSFQVPSVSSNIGNLSFFLRLNCTL